MSERKVVAQSQVTLCQRGTQTFYRVPRKNGATLLICRQVATNSEEAKKISDAIAKQTFKNLRDDEKTSLHLTNFKQLHLFLHKNSKTAEITITKNHSPKNFNFIESPKKNKQPTTTASA